MPTTIRHQSGSNHRQRKNLRQTRVVREAGSEEYKNEASLSRCRRLNPHSITASNSSSGSVANVVAESDIA
jgi:hypothetical protein